VDSLDLLSIAVFVQAVAYLFFLYELSQHYRSYVLSGNPQVARNRAIITLALSIAVFALFLCVVALALQSIIIILVVVLFVMAALVRAIRLRFSLRCLERKEEELDGIKYVLCRSDVANAWYDYRGKAIYVSSRLKEVLSEEELKAVIHHESGHAKHRKLGLLKSLIDCSWLYAVTGIALLITLLREISLISMLAILYLVFSAATITLPATVISWVNEHESDREAFLKSGLQPFMAALIKTHVYGSLGRYSSLIDNVKIKEAKEIIDVITASATPKQIYNTLLKYSWNFPKWILDLIINPSYYTHPPLSLRLALLMTYHTRRELGTPDKEQKGKPVY